MSARYTSMYLFPVSVVINGFAPNRGLRCAEHLLPQLAAPAVCSYKQFPPTPSFVHRVDAKHPVIRDCKKKYRVQKNISRCYSFRTLPTVSLVRDCTKQLRVQKYCTCSTEQNQQLLQHRTLPTVSVFRDCTQQYRVQCPNLQTQFSRKQAQNARFQ